MEPEYLKIFDVNFNRAKEGLRVVEEILRFVANDKKLTLQAKVIRHKLVAVFKKNNLNESALNVARQVSSDVGKKAVLWEKKSGFLDIFFSNIHRSEEALRVLEEISSLYDFRLFKNFKSLRFEVYQLEKTALKKLKALSYC